jgi:hypothetical protein
MKYIMKHLLSAFLFLFLGYGLKCQTLGEVQEGSVSFVTSQNVYVKFQSTKNISAGDTLFIIKDTKKIPALIVKDLSSISCVCTRISKNQFVAGDKVSTQRKVVEPRKSDNIVIAPIITHVATAVDTVTAKKEVTKELKQNISGRISVSAYSNFSSESDLSQRMQYTFALNARNIGDSRLSGEAYISFAHKIKEWDVVKANIYNGLKIYSLSLNYAFNKNNTIWVGRRINNRISNVGSIDGLQYETKFKSLTAGVFAGTRPDYMDYSFNSKLLQYGGYLSHDLATAKGNMQSTMAFVEQTNNGNTDRRFAYFQHSNSLLPSLYFFGSVEFDLFSKVLNTQDSTYTQDNKPSLSNVYVSLRYKVFKKLSLALSYSTRQNIIYYETYKTIIDQLLAMASTQGYMFQANYRPTKNLAIGANAGYRFSKVDPRPSKNLYSYVTYSNVPWLNASATVSATILETTYLSGSIYSIGLSRDLIPGKLYGGLDYRHVNYKFLNSESPLVQNMAEMNMTWRILKKLSCSLNYEGTFEKGRNYDRIYVNLTQRF